MRHGENHVRLQALHRAPPQQPTQSVVKTEGRPVASVKPGQENCVIKSISAYTLSARSFKLENSYRTDPAPGGQSIPHLMQSTLRVTKPVIGSLRGHQCSATTLTGESRFHISPPRGFEPESLVVGSNR